MPNVRKIAFTFLRPLHPLGCFTIRGNCVVAGKPNTSLPPLVLWDQFGNETRAEGMAFVLWRAQQFRPGVRPGTLNGLDATQKPKEPSIEEQSRLRYLKMKAEEKSRKESTTGSDSERHGAIPGQDDRPEPDEDGD